MKKVISDIGVMLNLKCEKCGKILKHPGALIFSPPALWDKGVDNNVLKFHLCRHCYSLLCDWLERAVK